MRSHGRPNGTRQELKRPARSARSRSRHALLPARSARSRSRHLIRGTRRRCGAHGRGLDEYASPGLASTLGGGGRCPPPARPGRCPGRRLPLPIFVFGIPASRSASGRVRSLRSPAAALPASPPSGQLYLGIRAFPAAAGARRRGRVQACEYAAFPRPPLRLGILPRLRSPPPPRVGRPREYAGSASLPPAGPPGGPPCPPLALAAGPPRTRPLRPLLAGAAAFARHAAPGGKVAATPPRQGLAAAGANVALCFCSIAPQHQRPASCRPAAPHKAGRRAPPEAKHHSPDTNLI